VIFIDGIVFSLQNSGGISVYFCEILKRLDSKAFVLLYSNNNHSLKESISDFKANCDLKYSFLSKSLIKLTRYLDVSVPKSASVFHSSYYRVPFFWQRKRLKVITTVHDFTYERMRTGISAFIHRQQKRRAINASDVIVCISESTKSDLLHFFPESKSKDIRVIYNGVSDEFYPIANKVNSAEQPFVLFVGARSGYKNFIALVDALTNLKDMRLVIVGGGPLSDVEKSKLDKTLSGRYQHFIYVSNSELNEFYNNAFCFVYPSLYEGFGIPVIESMKSGCPVIASASSSIPEVAGDAALLINDISPEKILSAITLLSDQKKRDDFIRRGFENAKRFDWEFTYQKLRELYLE